MQMYPVAGAITFNEFQATVSERGFPRDDYGCLVEYGHHHMDVDKETEAWLPPPARRRLMLYSDHTKPRRDHPVMRNSRLIIWEPRRDDHWSFLGGGGTDRSQYIQRAPMACGSRAWAPGPGLRDLEAEASLGI